MAAVLAMVWPAAPSVVDVSTAISKKQV